MDCKKEELLSITLKDKEIDDFVSIIGKCKKESEKIGFKDKRFTSDENKLLEDINKALE